MIDAAVASLLRTASGLTDVAPWTAFVAAGDVPRIVYTALGGERPYTDQGVAGIVSCLYQVDVIAVTATAARAMLAAIMQPVSGDGLDGFTGEVEDTTIERISFADTPRMAPPQVTTPGANQSLPRLIVSMRVDYRE